MADPATRPVTHTLLTNGAAAGGTRTAAVPARGRRLPGTETAISHE